MGVRGLETFIEKYCPENCCYDVSIEELVEQYREETGEDEPLMVIDTESTLRFLYKDLDWVCGGQFKEYLARIRRFLDAFKSIGVQMVFFFGGSHPEVSRRNQFVANNKEKLDKISTLFSELGKGANVDEVPKNLAQLPVNFGLLQILEVHFGCEVHNMINDAEIIQYARENKCFAVFGQDSDLLITETGKYYLSAKNFKFDGLQTKLYDRQNLAKFVGLKPSQLPIFATLLGNDFINYRTLRNFHKSLRPDGFFDFSKYFPAVANYVKQLPEGDALLEALPDVAHRVFRNENLSSLLSVSIRNYLSPIKMSITETGNPEWDAILHEAEIFHRANINATVILTVLSNKPNKESASLEDYGRIIVDLPPSAIICRPLRQRLYGIILKEKPKNVNPFFIHEWLVEGPVVEYEPFLVKPIVPTDQHPGLLTLWGNDRSPEMQTIRWQLFTGAISPDLNPTDLTGLPDYLILPSSALFYLAKRDVFEPWEIEALMVTVITLPTVTLDELIDLCPDPVAPRAVHITTVFLRSLNVVRELFNVVGFPISRRKIFSHPYFDGKLFQESYRRISNGELAEDLCENKGSCAALYQTIHRILFEKKESQ